MARPREFDERIAREQALQVFWDKGYEAASLQDLLSAMGLSKSTFYETFSSKRDLYLDSMDHYSKTEMGFVALLESDAPARDAIERVFHAVIDAAFSEGGRCSCFLVNCVNEVKADDKQVSDRVTEATLRFESAFETAIRRGMKARDIETAHDPHALAHFLVSSLNGLRVMLKSSHDRTSTESVVQIVMAALG